MRNFFKCPSLLSTWRNNSLSQHILNTWIPDLILGSLPTAPIPKMRAVMFFAFRSSPFNTHITACRTHMPYYHQSWNDKKIFELLHFWLSWPLTHHPLCKKQGCNPDITKPISHIRKAPSPKQSRHSFFFFFLLFIHTWLFNSIRTLSRNPLKNQQSKLTV